MAVSREIPACLPVAEARPATARLTRPVRTPASACRWKAGGQPCRSYEVLGCVKRAGRGSACDRADGDRLAVVRQLIFSRPPGGL